MADEVETNEFDNDALTAAHLAIENALIEFRDSRISMPMCANGFVVKEKDGSRSDIIRLGTRAGLEIGIRAYREAMAAKAIKLAEKEGL